jgi:hypothetical protein
VPSGFERAKVDTECFFVKVVSHNQHTTEVLELPASRLPESQSKLEHKLSSLNRSLQFTIFSQRKSNQTSTMQHHILKFNKLNMTNFSGNCFSLFHR